jgi:hypothetical protein
MAHRFRRWLGGARGAATTEKLVVLLFAIVLIGGGMMVFGPVLAKKYSLVAEMLGAEPEPARTLADGRPYEGDGTNPIWYVVFAVGVSVFALGFAGPLLFPRARKTRARMLHDLGERLPFLAPLVRAESHAHGMQELRGLADELEGPQQGRGALEIKPRDFGQMASPADATLDGGAAVDLPAPPQDFGTKRSGAGGIDDFGQLALGQGDDEATVNVDPEPSHLDDGIPFDAVSPSAKPQMRPDPRTRRKSSDQMAADILRQSEALGVAADADATIVRDVEVKPVQRAGADPDAPTHVRNALSRNETRRSRKSNPDATLPAEIRRADDPDATTQTYSSYDSKDRS